MPRASENTGTSTSSTVPSVARRRAAPRRSLRARWRDQGLALQEAQELGIDGRSKMNKDDLAQAIEKEK